MNGIWIVSSIVIVFINSWGKKKKKTQTHLHTKQSKDQDMNKPGLSHVLSKTKTSRIRLSVKRACKQMMKTRRGQTELTREEILKSHFPTLMRSFLLLLFFFKGNN